jgi:hypothetical protein
MISLLALDHAHPRGTPLARVEHLRDAAAAMTAARALPSAAVLLCTLIAGCGDDTVEIAPYCDDIGWPLSIEPMRTPPPVEYAVECAEGWGNAVPTRPELATVAMPGSPWTGRPHPAGGWIMAVFPSEPDWTAWLEQQGVDLDALPGILMLWLDGDGALGWIVPEYAVWQIELVGDELWVLGSDDANEPWLLAFDPLTGALIHARAWDFSPRFSLIAAARDPGGGVWISAVEEREQDNLVNQFLYRAPTLDTIELVATRTTQDPGQLPFGNIEPLVDGAVAWSTTVEGFEVVEQDGSVRWTRPQGSAHASDADSLLVVSLVPTGVGAGQALRLEKAAVTDGASAWVREHQRYTVAVPEHCGAEECRLRDIAFPTLRSDGGYLLAGSHAYPSETCPAQPLLIAVSSFGEAEWAHRVETCGRAFWIAARGASTFELVGSSLDDAGTKWAGVWVRSFEL